MTASLAADQAEITALICRYADLIDAGDFDGITDLFEHAVVRSGDHAFSGRDTLRGLWADLVHTYEGGRTMTRHLITNIVVEVEEGADSARARSSATVLQAVPPDFPLQVVATSRHLDRFARLDGVWRFVERVDVTDLVGDMTRHTRQPYHSGGEQL